MVKFPSKYGPVKVALVSAAQRHTLILDTDNKLWYFGAKESVGVKAQDD